MLNYLFVCRSVTHAQRTAKALESAGIGSAVTRAPHGLASGGCAYCVRVPGRHMAQALVAVKNAGLPPARVYAQSESGCFREVNA
jgi:rhodanese-related sulfurtransferase